MRRIALPFGRGLFVAVALLALLAATFPARLAAAWLGLGTLGVGARAIEGPIWSAHAREAQVAGLPLGDLDAGLNPLALLAGRARIGFAGEGDTRGALTVSRHTTALDVARLTLPAGTRFAPLPIASLAFEGLRVRFRDDVCDAAEGRARVDLTGDPGGLGLPGSLAGDVRCDAGALAMALASAGGRERLTLRFDGDGRDHAALLLAPADAAATVRLAAVGFRPAPGGYALALDGVW